MKVFVAGATGVIGHRAVREFVAAGHEVTGIARTDAKAAMLEALGATSARVDLFDGPALTDAVAGHAAVVNLATHIPPLSAAARRGAWAENDRIRREGSGLLVDAALAGGAQHYVQESISFTYPDKGDQWIDESTPMDPTPGVESVRDAEGNARHFAHDGHGTGIVLRFGLFYGPGSSHTDAMVKAARRGIGASTGARSGFVSSIHVDDAAAAVVAAVGIRSGIYNVVDDEPVTRQVYAQSLGLAVGRPRVWLFPGRLARFGGRTTATLVRSQRVSNKAFKATSGWAPRYPSVTVGWPAVVAAIDEEAAVDA